MSLYNAIMGFNPACVALMPMLGRTQQQYPRFRDCFLSEDGKYIEIYTRVGGNNRGCGFGEEALYEDPNFVTTYDDDYDSTYATYVFKAPDKWKADFDLIVSGNMAKVSEEYVGVVKEFYPTLTEYIDKLFERNSDERIEHQNA